MTRTKQNTPLLVYLNNKHVGCFEKKASGAVEFHYDKSWLDWEYSIPISLSLPLREEVFRGERVTAVFENLLPDSDLIRRRVAERVGARGIDAYSLLAKIGRDCVGALQFVPEGGVSFLEDLKIEGEEVNDNEIEVILKNLSYFPFGLQADDAFRISLAGAQEKTALLWNNNRWMKPHGATPTTHIFKTQIGYLPNGIDLSYSIENEYYCLKLIELFGLKTNYAEIKTFGKTRALVIERFDRYWTKDNRLLRIPQEDLCQALSIPPTLKYQREGGPGIEKILRLLAGSDTPIQDQCNFSKAQILFWLIGAPDGHAKNFSIFLEPGGRFRLTPLYDIMTVQPSLVKNQIDRKQMKMAMFVGDARHYHFDEITGRHFSQTAIKGGMPNKFIKEIIENILEQADMALNTIGDILPENFPEEIHNSVQEAIRSRLYYLKLFS